MNYIQVKKRNGEKEPFSVEKINKVLKWACEGVKGVSVSDIEVFAKMNISNGITTKDIHKILIDSAVNLLNEDSPNYGIVAGRLINFQLRKEVWRGNVAPHLRDFTEVRVRKGFYDKEILKDYTEEEFDFLNKKIDHNRDWRFTYAGMAQLTKKYLAQDRQTKNVYETPQFAYMLIAMTSFRKYDKETRLKYVVEAYERFSKHKINLPTPQAAGVRTPKRAYSSCCLIDVDDTKHSIFHSMAMVGMATSDRFGIGLNVGRIRPVNAKIGSGEVVSTGLIPFIKSFAAITKSCHQNGVRGGGATVNVPFWHPEILSIVVLKNIGGTEESRARNLDYVIQFSRLFYERFQKKEDITLFSPHEVPDLYEAFGSPEFDALYLKYEEDTKLKFRQKLPARELMSLFTKERCETHRIYVMNIDHVNSHGSWDVPVHMTNLCVEVVVPTKPITHFDDPNGEIGICVLSALNVLEIQDEEDLRATCDIIVRMLDELIDHQEWFAPAAANFIINRRSLGIGVTNFAAWLAKRNLKYSEKETPYHVDELFEGIQYHLLRASNQLAREKGRCAKFHETKYSRGVLPIDTYKKTVDEIVKREYRYDWEALRADIIKDGLRHSSLTALMPCESSSLVQSSTNGIEPIRNIVTYKGSKVGSDAVVAPHSIAWKNRYEKQFDMPNMDGYIHIVAVMQKWIDMAISANMYYDHKKFPGGMVSHQTVIADLLKAYRFGIKNLYYSNITDGDEQSVGDTGCDGGSCSV